MTSVFRVSVPANQLATQVSDAPDTKNERGLPPCHLILESPLVEPLGEERAREAPTPFRRRRAPLSLPLCRLGRLPLVVVLRTWENRKTVSRDV